VIRPGWPSCLRGPSDTEQSRNLARGVCARCVPRVFHVHESRIRQGQSLSSSRGQRDSVCLLAEFGNNHSKCIFSPCGMRVARSTGGTLAVVAAVCSVDAAHALMRTTCMHSHNVGCDDKCAGRAKYTCSHSCSFAAPAAVAAWCLKSLATHSESRYYERVG
jgi:hypothetical protein